MFSIKNNHIGERCGPYKIIDKTLQNNRILYVGECVYCGAKTIQSISDFHKLKNDSCHHYDRFGFPTFHANRDSISNPRIVKIFCKMKDRCYDTSASDYKFYGAKGIKICNEWLHHPNEFISWSLKNGYRDDLTIDRIDSSKNYCPENCRWIPRQLNFKHKSTTNYYMIPVTGREAARIMGVGPNYVNVYAREHGHEETQRMIDRYMNERVLDKRS